MAGKGTVPGSGMPGLTRMPALHRTGGLALIPGLTRR
jgi:hypothetical protein